MLVSPAEPKVFHHLGKLSNETERRGVDFLFPTIHYGLVGVQRKEVNDLIASIQGKDSRLAKELAQMKSLGLAALLIEGKVSWTNDGLLISRTQFTQAQLFGVIWAVQLSGIWVSSTSSLDESIRWLSLFQKWLQKPRHGSLMSRNKAAAKGIWGKADSRDWGIWLLQGFEGIGYDTAAAIYDHFKGVPLQWAVTEEQLREVKGVGKGRARALIKALKSGESSNPTPPPRPTASTSNPTVAPASTTTLISPSVPYIELDEIIGQTVPSS